MCHDAVLHSVLPENILCYSVPFYSVLFSPVLLRTNMSHNECYAINVLCNGILC